MTRGKSLKPALLLAVPAVLAGCDMPPEGISDEDLAHYESAVASVGCVLRSESDYLPVELQTDLSRQQVLDITGYYLSTEQAERTAEGGVKLTTGACA